MGPGKRYGFAGMDESTYQQLADKTFRVIVDAFEHVDTDLVDCEIAGDVVTLTFAGVKRCIINTQRPVRQIWIAANARAWHFSWTRRAGAGSTTRAGARTSTERSRASSRRRPASICALPDAGWRTR